MSRGTAMVAMSGGVDSSVAALLLKDAGYRVIGVTMRLWTLERTEVPAYQKGCCSVEDVEDARRVCQILGAPHYYLNFEREFRAYVVDYFCREYARGRTPHPCIACNDRMKSDLLLQRANLLGADYIATGHYARITAHEGRWRLLKGVDISKDQSYVLFNLTQEEMKRTLLPVGWYSKAEIRRIAREAGLPVADKPDSQEICFIPGGDYRRFLEDRIPSRPGDIVDSQGHFLGKHPGIAYFTVGQRRGLGLAPTLPLYVLALDARENRVVVGNAQELEETTLWAEDISYTSGDEPSGPVEVMAKVRYKAPEVSATLYPQVDSARVEFHGPQRAITPGQAVVFYQGEEVLGGGIINRRPLQD